MAEAAIGIPECVQFRNSYNRSGAMFRLQLGQRRGNSSFMTLSSAMHGKPGPLLGIEAGGTRTVALLADVHGNLLRRIEAGSANLRLLTDPGLQAVLHQIASQIPTPVAVGIGMAGLRTESDRRRVQTAVAEIWGTMPLWVGNDLETALAAAGDSPGHEANVLILSGTGSCCFGRSANGRMAKVGGWGHLLGDQGSGFDIAMQTLRLVITKFDQTGRWPSLGAQLLRALMLNEPNDLLAWVQSAPKDEVARLAPEVFAAWRCGDALAGFVVREAAQRLGKAGLDCACRLNSAGSAVRFIFAGGVLLAQPKYASLVRMELLRSLPDSQVECLPREGAWGALEFAKSALDGRQQSSTNRLQRTKSHWRCGLSMLPTSTKLSPTERRNPRSMRLSQLALRDAIRLMLTEDQHIPAALFREARVLSRAIRMIVRALKQGGRLFYVGAGTSGRLGVLDASECPPTFRTPPELVQGIMAGGANALWRSVEGAEDDFAAGARALHFRGVTRKDIVIGIAASGQTPFVWGALQVARESGAQTGFLCFNPHLRFPRAIRPDVVIAPKIGPEILTGSTRLKAGTATKIILNLFTTLAMIRLGKVESNLMVDVNPSNAKLRERAVRIVQQLTGAEESNARQALEKSGWVVKRASAWLARMEGFPPARSGRIRAARRAATK